MVKCGRWRSNTQSVEWPGIHVRSILLSVWVVPDPGTNPVAEVVKSAGCPGTAADSLPGRSAQGGAAIEGRVEGEEAVQLRQRQPVQQPHVRRALLRGHHQVRPTVP